MDSSVLGNDFSWSGFGSWSGSWICNVTCCDQNCLVSSLCVYTTKMLLCLSIGLYCFPMHLEGLCRTYYYYVVELVVIYLVVWPIV